ncbi:hypothetical protein EV356DRAFT_508587 [Viridothelium virens]|uniref:Uncharacterized protein n=1 Tax=Viridothelium virens TaxID=1048519 RepID=A0A6A6HKL2_VIRVR|nr:hypothetical protein EV356DRAFT_508587 [Viridothelium virens]
MASQLMLLNEFLPANALNLGGLVESVKNPVMDAYMPKIPLLEDSILSMPAKSFQALLSSNNSTSFRLALTKLLKTSHNIQDGSDVSLQSMKVNRYQLKQPKQIFKKLCQEDEEARNWLNDGIQAGNKSYLVVELQIAENPTLSAKKTKSHQTDADVTVPVSTIATGGADILGVGAALDVGVGAGYLRSTENQKSMSLEGGGIFAIGYKKVMWKSWGFKKKEIDKAVLDDEITWSILGEKRGTSEAEEFGSLDLVDDLAAKDDREMTDEEDGEDEEDDEDEVVKLLKNGAEVDGQTYLIPGGLEEGE